MNHLPYPKPASDVPAPDSDPDDHTAGDTEQNRDVMGVRSCVDSEYYFELVVFKVGNTIFRVPKNGFLVPGTIFEDLFSLPTIEGIVEGSDDQNPINLPVNEDDFRGFLRAIYPFNGIRLENADWIRALDLSTMWMFDEVRNRAIEALEVYIANLDAKEVVLLAKKYRVLKWLRSGYNRLLWQNPIVSTFELSAVPSLDWESIARLLSVKLQSIGRYHSSGSYSEPMVQEFREEFSRMG